MSKTSIDIQTSPHMLAPTSVRPMKIN